MISSKTIYSKYFREYQLEQADLEKLQAVLLGMFVDFKAVCDKYNINYMMSGGTLLGTVRHKGFIPWDDDIDIMMLREEYERFSQIFNEELGEKYILAEPLSDDKYVFKAPKIYKKETTYIEIENIGINKFDMVFLDIFIIENVPAPGFQRNVLSLIYNFAFKAASVCVDYIYPSPIIIEKSKQEKEIEEYYSFRRKLGFLFSHIGGMRFYIKITQIIVKRFDKSEWMGVPSAISYNREIFSKKLFTEIVEGDFCGYKVKIPKRYDEYLTNLYGNYMELPPEEKREIHVAYKVVI